MTDQQILIWIHQRLVKVHGEDVNVDYMHRFREAISQAQGSSTLYTLGNSQAVLDYINKLENTDDTNLTN
jgi:hypothetical protein